MGLIFRTLSLAPFLEGIIWSVALVDNHNCSDCFVGVIFNLNGLSIPIIDTNMAVKGQKMLQAPALPILYGSHQKFALPVSMRGVETMAKGHNKCFHRTIQVGRTSSYK